MNSTTKKQFIQSLLMTTIEATEKQETLFKRGFITETERITEVQAIIEKVSEMISNM